MARQRYRAMTGQRRSAMTRQRFRARRMLLTWSSSQRSRSTAYNHHFSDIVAEFCAFLLCLKSRSSFGSSATCPSTTCHPHSCRGTTRCNAPILIMPTFPHLRSTYLTLFTFFWGLTADALDMEGVYRLRNKGFVGRPKLDRAFRFDGDAQAHMLRACMVLRASDLVPVSAHLTGDQTQKAVNAGLKLLRLS